MNLIVKPALLSLLVACSILFSSFQTESKRGLGRVTKIEGVEVYFMAEPLRKYVKVIESDGLLGNVSVKSLASGGMSTPTIAEKAQRLIKNTVNTAAKDGKQIDAVIYSGGKYVIGVKFVEAPGPSTEGISRVKKINGVDLFVFSEPLSSYEQVSEGKAKKRSGSSFMTGGLVNSAIDEDLGKLVDHTKDDDIKLEDFAVIYNTGKTGIGIQYK